MCSVLIIQPLSSNPSQNPAGRSSGRLSVTIIPVQALDRQASQPPPVPLFRRIHGLNVHPAGSPGIPGMHLQPSNICFFMFHSKFVPIRYQSPALINFLSCLYFLRTGIISLCHHYWPDVLATTFLPYHCPNGSCDDRPALTHASRYALECYTDVCREDPVIVMSGRSNCHSVQCGPMWISRHPPGSG